MGNQITAWSCRLGNGSSDDFLLRHADTIPAGNLQSGLLWLGREWRISCLLRVKGTSPAGEWSHCFLLLLRRWWQISSVCPPHPQPGNWSRHPLPWWAPWKLWGRERWRVVSGAPLVFHQIRAAIAKEVFCWTIFLLVLWLGETGFFGRGAALGWRLL